MLVLAAPPPRTQGTANDIVVLLPAGSRSAISPTVSTSQARAGMTGSRASPKLSATAPSSASVVSIRFFQQRFQRVF